MIKYYYRPITRMSLLPELNGPEGRAIPPVAPEVIHILLSQRSNRWPDALSEHVVARALSGGEKFH